MASIFKTPNAQSILSATYTFNMGSTGSAFPLTNFPGTPDKGLQSSTYVVGANPSTETLVAFSASNTGTAADFLMFTLPYLAEVVSGDVNVVTASNDTGTSTIAIGDTTTYNRYLSNTTLKSPGVTALVPTGYQTNGETLTCRVLNQNGNATAGQVIIRVNFVLLTRATENLRTT